MKIVVFGANGGVGRRVVEQLLVAGHSVTAVVQVRLLRDTGYSYARQAVLDRLRSHCPDPTLLPEEP